MCSTLTFILEYSCGHRYPKDSQKVDCRSKECRLSIHHETIAHNCLQRCKQGLVMSIA
ncbi:hypothetical protein EXIGLDRAFT_622317 [Exidia glandulosa HHB12029]|uniref:Uncharacterized protein n=1 Tax=Exidia glandulosa HHB12029 TaxID=1314781 RepID=A0A165E5C3_EXIGL|nr:hypothetical protein EXIGLDRAFT_622317 [Exidia glandulosa HHB12029]